MRFLVSLVSVLCFTFSLMAEKEAGSVGSGSSESVALDVSKGFSSVVDKVLPAVVSVQATQVIEARGDGTMSVPGMSPHGRMGPGNPLEELFREFMGQMERPRKSQAVGAGFIVYCNGKIAYVVTNHHVVTEAKTLVVVLEDKTEVPGTLLASDARNDVAVIKLDLSSLPADKRNLPTVSWANSEEVKTGDWVIAIGNPFNFGNTVTVGVVSHKGRYVPSGMQQDFEFIQHSAQINVGSSGGALFNTKGEVIGINNAIITNTGGNIGIGFAIPANIARQTVDQLLKYGKTRRGQLGIRIQAFDKNMAESQGMDEIGVIVGSVIEKGPAEGKLEVGDIILAYEGKKVTESHILSRLVGETEIGKTVTVRAWRKGKMVDVKIKVDEMPDAKKDMVSVGEKADQKSKSIVIAGIEIAEIPAEIKERMAQNNKEPHGVIVINIDQNLAGDQISLLPGDIIEEANGKELSTPSDFESIVKKAKENKRKNILLLISRDGKPAYMPLRIDAEEEAKKPEPKQDNSVEEKSKSEEEAKKAEEQKSVEAAPELIKPELAQEEEKVDEQKSEEFTSHKDEVLPKHEDEQDVSNQATQEHGVAKGTKSALESNNNKSFLSKLADKFKSFIGRG
ncbi:MAG: trypsin-like peptidase domain-containing protein [Proteobacteria bacterium]|nr:trypsin-like peptidase domain-containing protein [Pseudomonadota bacterium]